MAATGTGADFNIGRVVQRTVDLIGRNFASFSILSLLFAGAPYLAMLLLLPRIATAALGPDSAATGWALFGVGAVYFLGSMLLLASLTRASVDDLSGKPVGIGSALTSGLRVLLPMLGLLLLFLGIFFVSVMCFAVFTAMFAFSGSVIPMVLATVAFVVVLVIMMLRWLVATPVLVIERPGVIASLRRSSALTETHRWAILGLLVLYAILVMIVQGLLSLAVPGVADMLVGAQFGAPPLIAVVVLVLLQAFSMIVVTVMIASVYFELRQIKEGVGVTELAQVFA
jgi:hypothetical protein